MNEKGKWVNVPIGNARDNKAPKYLRSKIRLSYGQREMNACVVSSFASALSYISTKPHHEYIKKAADRLAELAKSLEGKDIQVCLNQIRGVMEAYVPSIARYTKANIHRKKEGKMSLLRISCLN